MFKPVFLVIAVIVAFATLALPGGAAHAEGYYASIKSGPDWGAAKADVDEGVALALGREFSNWRSTRGALQAEIELYGGRDTQPEFRRYYGVATLVARYLFTPEERVSPFVGVGAGVAVNICRVGIPEDDPCGPGGNTEDYSLTFQGAVGLSLDGRERFPGKLSIEFRALPVITNGGDPVFYAVLLGWQEHF